MFSPTGYYAHFITQSAQGGNIYTHPILWWDAGGRPVIADGFGRLVTVDEHGTHLTRRMAPGASVNWSVSPEA